MTAHAELLREAREMIAAGAPVWGRTDMLRRIDAALAALPAGWVMVPAEPTDEMLNAGARAHLYKTSTLWYGGQGADIYRAMLAAAEKP